MSYNFPSLTRNQMQAMVPLMSNITNGANFMPQLAVAAAAAAGTLPQLTAGPPPSLLPSHLQAGLNDSPLEFKKTTTNPSSTLKQQQPSISSTSYNKNLCLSDKNNVKLHNNNNNNNNDNQMGAGPMDLENDNDSPNISNSNETAVKRLGIGRNDHKVGGSGDDDTSSIHTNDSTGCGGITSVAAAAAAAANKSILMSNEMFLNGMLGVGPPNLHNNQYMMMSGMMMDPTMAATLQMQQFPLMAAAAAAATLSQPSTSVTQPNNSNLESNAAVTAAQSSLVPVQVKELITCKSCTLYPPNPNAPPPTIRERPPGCRTVFVGGLPEKITEDILREIFERCGEITTLRLSKKNFCHIRFVFEASVDSAIYLSGYRLRIANSSEPANCGRLHVDYAQARDDQYEWECKQRQLQREQRHRERMERDRLRSMSPPPIVHYTEHEASNISEKLKNDETFIKAVQTLIAWLERGDCSKKNSNTFYSMIQSTNAHVRRLQNDKQQYEEELKRAREQYRKQMLNMTQQFTQIEKVFSAASHKKVWDHFTKAQRKNIDLWKKQSMEIRCVQIEDDEMEMSDDDRDYKSSHPNKRAKYDNESLKEENDSLRCQLEAYKNEMNLVKSDIKSDSDIREQQIKVLQETIRNLQTQLIENKMKEKEFITKINDFENKLKKAKVKELLLKTKIVEANAKNSSHNNSDIDENEKFLQSNESQDDEILISASSSSSSMMINRSNTICDNNNEKNTLGNILPTTVTTLPTVVAAAAAVTTATASTMTMATTNLNNKIEPIKYENFDRNEAKLIGLTSTFLVIHPFGASSDYICSYLQKLQPNLRPRDLEELLSRYNNLFCEEITGIGAKIERKWKFCGFDNINNCNNNNSNNNNNNNINNNANEISN